MAALFGQMCEFDPDKEDWTQYSERLNHFFAANDIGDAAKKKAILLTVVGPATYKQLRSLVSPAKVDDKTYKQLVEALGSYHSPKPSEIVQRYRFNSRYRQPGESVSTYVSELRALAEFCNYGTALDDMLRDRMVCGINDTQIQRRLLSEQNLTFETAHALALGIETAAKNMQTLQGSGAGAGNAMLVAGSGEVTVHKMEPRSQLQEPEGPQRPGGSCYRCGQTGHTAARCRFRTANCHNCGRTGHLKAVCRSQTKKHRYVHPQGDVKNLQAEEYDVSPEYALFSMESREGQKPILVEVQIDGCSLQMEVDTGAALSVVSEATFQSLWPNKPLEPSTVRLRTYTGEQVQVLGSVPVDVRHGCSEGKLPLLVVKGDGPSLLGRNWLQSLQLDWRLIHHLNDSPLEEVLRRHGEVFKEELGTLRDHKVKIDVDPAVRPRFCRARPVPYALRSLVEKELDRLVHQGILEPVQFAEWAAPIVPVLKADKSLVRICGDFKMTVNQASRLDRYPIPKIDDLFAGLHGGKVFSKLDVSQAYHQLLLDEDSKKLAVINTHRGLFRYNRLPFGVSSAPAIFQRVMENLFQGIPNVVVYFDDILISGSTEEAHLQTLDKALDRVEKAGLKLNRRKCNLMASSVVYLGHKIDQHGLHPTEEKIRAVQSAPAPRNLVELKSYLGLLNYYGKFLPNLSTTLAPLYRLLGAKAPWRWTAVEQKAFESSQQLLTSTRVLTHFDPTQKLVLACDASPYGLGAVLSHRLTDDSEKPIGYASRTLSAAEKNYSQVEKEGLACVFGVKRFHQYIYGHHFTLCTDHKPLLSLFNERKSVPAQASARIQRWALTLASYEYTLEYKKSTAHCNADALSRLPLLDTVQNPPLPAETVLLMEQLGEMPITAEEVKLWTRRDPTLARVLQFVQHGWPSHRGEMAELSRVYWEKRLELSTQSGCLLWGNRVVIPPPGRAGVLSELHEAHPGSTRMKRLARTFVWWPNIDKDIEDLVRQCPACQEVQSSPPPTPIQPLQWPTRPWSRVHVDLAGPFMGRMFLILVDAHSKWIEARILPSTTSTSTIQCLRQIFAIFGLPEVLVSDNGPNFTSAEFEQFLRRNGVKHKTSAPYHPSTNGLAERAVQTFKRGMMKMTVGTIQDKMSRFLFAYRNTPQSTTGVSPAELLLGRKPRSALDLLKPDLQNRVEREQERQKQACDVRAKPRLLGVGDHVYVKNFPQGSSPHWLSGTITESTGPLSFHIVLTDGRVIRRHIDHIRRRYSSQDEEEVPVGCDAMLTPPQAAPKQVHADSATVDVSETHSSGSDRDEAPTVSSNDHDQGTTHRYPVRERRPPERYIPTFTLGFSTEEGEVSWTA